MNETSDQVRAIDGLHRITQFLLGAPLAAPPPKPAEPTDSLWRQVLKTFLFVAGVIGGTTLLLFVIYQLFGPEIR